MADSLEVITWTFHQTLTALHLQSSLIAEGPSAIGDMIEPNSPSLSFTIPSTMGASLANNINLGLETN